MAFEAKRRLIAERTAALGALERSEERLRALSECSPAGIFAADEEGRNTYVNARLAEAIGAPVESFRGDGWQRYVHPEDREDFARSWKNAVERREAMSREMRFVSSAGRVLVTHVRSAPLVLANGQLVGYVVTCEDVTEQKAAAEARRRAEGQYRQLVESMDAVVWRAAGDPPRLTFVSQQAEDIFGREARALVGGELPVADLTRPEDVAAITADIATVRQRHAALQHEFRIRTADGRERWLRSLLRRVPDSAEPGEIIGVTFDVTELRCAQEELARSRQQLRDFASELQTIRERERTHIAREIHDELGQALTGLKMELAWLRTKLPKRSTKLVETAEHMVAQVDRTIETVRRIASALRPSVLDSLGLVAALEWLVREFERNTRMRCTLRVFDDRAEPGPERSTAVFRIVQEALTNVARHGNASSVEVTVARDGADLLVAVRDDGCGISAEAAHGSRSLGILGMRERAIASGGELAITAAPGGGTIVTVRVPLGALPDAGALVSTLVMTGGER
jgi:PAS domain S-box-containing protein